MSKRSAAVPAMLLAAVAVAVAACELLVKTDDLHPGAADASPDVDVEAEVDAGMDADPESEGPSDSAPESWCASQSNALWCQDFDEPREAGWFFDGGTATYDLSDAGAPPSLPFALLAIASPVEAGAVAELDAGALATGSGTLRVRFRLQVKSVPPRGTQVAALYYRPSGSFIAIRLTSPTEMTLVWGQNLTGNTVVRADAALPQDWPTVGLDFVLHDQSAGLVLNGVTVAETYVDAALMQAPTFTVGLHGPGPAEVAFDNVVVESY